MVGPSQHFQLAIRESVVCKRFHPEAVYYMYNIMPVYTLYSTCTCMCRWMSLSIVQFDLHVHVNVHLYMHIYKCEVNTCIYQRVS